MENNVREFILAVRTNSDGFRSKSHWVDYNLDVFNSVTQAVVVQFHVPEFFCAAFTSNIEKPDLFIQVVADLNTSEIPTRLPELLEPFGQQVFDSAWGNDHRESLRRVIEFAVKGFLDDYLRNAMTEHAGFIISPAKNVAIFRKIGLPQSLDANATVRKELALATQFDAQPFPQRMFFQATGHMRRISAARFLKVQPEPERPPTFSDEMKALFAKSYQSPWDLGEPFWRTKHHKVELTIFSTGVLVADTPHVAAGLDSLNAFLAMASFLGLFCVPANRWDLGSISVGPNGALQSWGGPSLVPRGIYWPKKAATEAELLNCIQVFEAAQHDLELMAQMRLRHAAAIHFLSAEYLQAFLLAWAVVEREIERRWLSQLQGRNLEPRRIQKLLKEDEFTVNQLIEILELFGRVDGGIHVLLQRLRKVRNDVVHRGLLPTDQQSGECLKVANTFISVRLEPLKSSQA